MIEFVDKGFSNFFAEVNHDISTKDNVEVLFEFKVFRKVKAAKGYKSFQVRVNLKTFNIFCKYLLK